MRESVSRLLGNLIPFRLTHSSEARVFGWEVYGKQRSQRSPVMLLHRAKLWFDNRIRWPLRYRFLRPYHVVKTDLEPGYYDVDTRMLHAVMALVVHYVEQERGGAVDFRDYIEDCRESARAPLPEGEEWRAEQNDQLNRQASTEEQILDLYEWWKFRRPAKHHREQEWLMALYSGDDVMRSTPVEYNGQTMYELHIEPNPTPFGTSSEHWAYKEALHDEDQQMLHRAIDLRGAMWT